MNQVKGIAYSVRHDFTYVARRKRSLNSRGVERNPGVRLNSDSAIRHLDETADFYIHPEYVEILERNVNNKQELLSLESLHSIQDHSSVNEHSTINKSHDFGTNWELVTKLITTEPFQTQLMIGFFTHNNLTPIGSLVIFT